LRTTPFLSLASCSGAHEIDRRESIILQLCISVYTASVELFWQDNVRFLLVCWENLHRYFLWRGLYRFDNVWFLQSAIWK